MMWCNDSAVVYQCFICIHNRKVCHAVSPRMDTLNICDSGGRKHTHDKHRRTRTKIRKKKETKPAKQQLHQQPHNVLLCVCFYPGLRFEDWLIDWEFKGTFSTIWLMTCLKVSWSQSWTWIGSNSWIELDWSERMCFCHYPHNHQYCQPVSELWSFLPTFQTVCCISSS